MATKLHKELTYRGLVWLNSKITASGKRWATELEIDAGYRVDACVFASFQDRFNREIYPKPKIRLDRMLIIFESKISKTDFNRTFKQNNRELKGNLHYIITPKDLITIDDIPVNWGWLIKSGNGLKEIKPSVYHEITIEFIYKVGYLMLWNAYNWRASIEDWELERGKLFNERDY